MRPRIVFLIYSLLLISFFAFEAKADEQSELAALVLSGNNPRAAAAATRLREIQMRGQLTDAVFQALVAAAGDSQQDPDGRIQMILEAKDESQAHPRARLELLMKRVESATAAAGKRVPNVDWAIAGIIGEQTLPADFLDAHLKELSEMASLPKFLTKNQASLKQVIQSRGLNATGEVRRSDLQNASEMPRRSPCDGSAPELKP